MIYQPPRMKFGIFLAPFHRHWENPTLSLERDLQLIEWLDELDYDEAWIGEHHSAGWETIASPEVFMGVAAQRTRRIMLGTGVVSLPYHHPLMVANRMVLLDHLTRGRVMLGVGPGALLSDAQMLGITPTRQREMMEESLGVIMRLLTETEPITHESDWFKLVNATLHLRSYTKPHLPIAVASVQSPAGVTLAGKYGVGVLSLGVMVGLRGAVDPKAQWAIAEETAAKHGKTMDRAEWRIVTPVHVAETKKQALEDIRPGALEYVKMYWEDALGNKRHVPDPDNEATLIDQLVESGQWIVGSPDDCIKGIERLQEVTGGFGGLLVRAQEYVEPAKSRRSYELLARYVMPRFQGSIQSLGDSYDRVVANVAETRAQGQAAIERAHQAYEQTFNQSDRRRG
ncbi:MAG: LLM class flavin-dependent oxidoreductase [Chloroflexota bacterium]